MKLFKNILSIKLWISLSVLISATASADFLSDTSSVMKKDLLRSDWEKDLICFQEQTNSGETLTAIETGFTFEMVSSLFKRGDGGQFCMFKEAQGLVIRSSKSGIGDSSTLEQKIFLKTIMEHIYNVIPFETAHITLHADDSERVLDWHQDNPTYRASLAFSNSDEDLSTCFTKYDNRFDTSYLDPDYNQKKCDHTQQMEENRIQSVKEGMLAIGRFSKLYHRQALMKHLAPNTRRVFFHMTLKNGTDTMCINDNNSVFQNFLDSLYTWYKAE